MNNIENYILVNVNMFSMDNKVTIISSLKESENVDKYYAEAYVGSYKLEQLPDFITTLAHEKGIYKVKIIGGEKYSKLIEYEIDSLENLKFNERKIEIEVI